MVCSEHPIWEAEAGPAGPARALPKQESKTHERVASPHCDDGSATLRDDGTSRAQNSKGDERLVLATMSWMREGVACLGQG
jgi:hypothetical protein